MHARTRKVAITEGVIAGFLFGTAAIFVRFLQSLDAFSIAFWRVTIASVALAALLVVLGKSFNFNLMRKNFKELVVLGVFLGLHFIFFVSAVKDTTILNATVLVNITPIFSMFLSSFFFNLKPSRLAVVGLIISFIGVFLIGYFEATIVHADLVGVSSLKGDLEAVLAALFIAFYLSYGRRIRSQMTIISTMLPIYLSAAVIIGFLSLPVASKTLVLPTEIGVILPLVGLGILPTATAHTLYFSSLSNLKSFETATMALLEPIGATILGVIVFNEVPAPLFVLGAALILLGIVFVAKEKL